jgi:hypothetical protein
MNLVDDGIDDLLHCEKAVVFICPRWSIYSSVFLGKVESIDRIDDVHCFVAIDDGVDEVGSFSPFFEWFRK